MNDLEQWLDRQLDEDSRIALTASPGPWHVNAESDEILAVDDVTVADGFALSGSQLRATTEHIATHNPARVLREIDATRQLLNEHQDVNDGSCGTCVDGQWGYPTHGGSSPQSYPCRTLRLLALPYADRPGYREEWRP